MRTNSWSQSKFEAPRTSISKLVHVAVPTFSVFFVLEGGEEGFAAVLFGGCRPSAAAIISVPLHLQRGWLSKEVGTLLAECPKLKSLNIDWDLEEPTHEESCEFNSKLPSRRH